MLSLAHSFAVLAALSLASLAPTAPAVTGASLPVASYVLPVDVSPVAGAGDQVEIAIAADIEGDVKAENLTPLLPLLCRVRPAVRVEVFTDSRLTQKLGEVTLDGVTAGFFHSGFDGSLDYAGTSGDAYTTSRVHRTATATFVVPPRRAPLARVWMRVRDAGVITTQGVWRAEVDTYAAVVASASQVTPAS